MIYVPALWGHATLNERQSVGVAYELFLEAFCSGYG
jgi:oxalate decarboxylase/phosphoglucose isomerase-like protein (cupin superfamily)